MLLSYYVSLPGEVFMDEIKSRWELISEKLKSIPSLSPEELQRDREAKYGAIGRATAERYLAHGHGKLFREEIDRYSEPIVRQAALSALIDMIDLDSADIIQKSIDGILSITGETRIKESCDALLALCSEYQQKKQQTYDREEHSLRLHAAEWLEQAGIAGDAVSEVNAEASPRWREIINKIRLDYKEKLDEMVKELCAFISSQ